LLSKSSLKVFTFNDRIQHIISGLFHEVRLIADSRVYIGVAMELLFY
jgi:hypothetical protein